MTHPNSTVPLEKMLMQFMTATDPMLGMLKWLCDQMMHAEFSPKWAPTVMNVRIAAMNTGLVTGSAEWIPGWVRSTSWFPNPGKAATFLSL